MVMDQLLLLEVLAQLLLLLLSSFMKLRIHPISRALMKAEIRLTTASHQVLWLRRWKMLKLW